MSVELLQTLSLVSYILAGVCFLLCIALFFLLDVPKLFGDVTGSNAKKAIESIRQQNEYTGDKAYKPSAVNVARGKVTDKISPSGRLQSKNSLTVAVGTEKFSTAKLQPNNETTVLSSETTVLSNASNETTVLSTNSNETTVLSNVEMYTETTVLDQADAPDYSFDNSSIFEIETELMFVGSSEIIQ